MPVPVLEFSDGRPGVPLAGTVVVGRAPGCGVQLDVEGVAGQHLRLSVEADGRVYLHDLAGTLRNGAPVLGRQALTHGDELALGPVRLRLRANGLPLPGETAQRTLTMSPEEVARINWAAAGLGLPAASAPAALPEALPLVDAEAPPLDPLGDLAPPAEAPRARARDAFSQTVTLTPSALKAQADRGFPRVLIRTPARGTAFEGAASPGPTGAVAEPAGPPPDPGATVVYAHDPVDAQAATDPNAGARARRAVVEARDPEPTEQPRAEHAWLKRHAPPVAGPPEQPVRALAPGVGTPLSLASAPGFDDPSELDPTDPDLALGARRRPNTDAPPPVHAGATGPSAAQVTVRDTGRFSTRLRRAFAFAAHMLALAAREGALFSPVVSAVSLAAPIAALAAIAAARFGGPARWAVLAGAAALIYAAITAATAMTAPLLHDLERRGALRRSEARARVAAALPALLLSSVATALLELPAGWARERQGLTSRLARALVRAAWTPATWALAPALTLDGVSLRGALRRARALDERDPTGSHPGAVAVSFATWLGAALLSPLGWAALVFGDRLHPVAGPLAVLLLFTLYGALAGWLRAAYGAAWYEWARACERTRSHDRSLAPTPLRETLEVGRYLQ